MKAEDIVMALAECRPACLGVPGCGLCYMPARIIPLDDGVKYQFTHTHAKLPSGHGEAVGRREHVPTWNPPHQHGNADV